VVANYRNTIRLFNRDTCLLLFAAAATGFSYTGVYVTLFNLYLLRLGYGPLFIGLINAAAQLGFAFFSLPAGILGSRYGSRNMSAIGLGVTVVSLALLPLAEQLPPAWQTAWLMAAFFIAWLSGALYLVNSYPLLMSVTGPAERNHAFAIRQALLPLGTFGGSLASGFLPGILAVGWGLSLDQPAPYRYALFSAVGVLVLGMASLLAIREVKPKQAQIRTVAAVSMPAGLITFMALLTLLEMAGQGAAATFFNVYLDDQLRLPVAWTGGLTALGQLLAVPVALVSPLAIARWGKRGTILAGFWGLGSSLLLLALIPHWAVASLAFIGVNSSYALLSPALLVCQQEIIPVEWRAAMSGAVIMGRGLGTAGMALGGGYLITTFGYPSLFFSGAALAIGGAILFWSYTWGPRWLLTRQMKPSLH
jgi:MFS family permease